MNNKCVYIHKLDGVVVYVGSGDLSRAYSKNKRSKDHSAVWGSLVISIITKDKTPSEAKKIEQDLICKYWDSGKLFNKKKTTDQVMILDYDFLSKWLYYDEESPSCLKWKQAIPTFHIKIGDNAGGMSKLGYYQVKLKSKLYKCHRIIWTLINKSDIKELYVIDHINRDRSDNRASNLRVVTISENNRNKKHKETNTGFQAICEHPKRMYFTVQFKNDTCENQSSQIFSYNTNSIRPARNHYPSRDEAFTAALDYRDELVKQGVITLTREK